MGEIVNMNGTNKLENVSDKNGLVELTEGLLMDARASIER